MGTPDQERHVPVPVSSGRTDLDDYNVISMSLQKHLVIFAKAPRMGRVKTRLARDIGGVRAWGFYRHALTGLVQRLSSDPRWQTYLAVAPDTACEHTGVWPAGAARFPQGLGDLGDRMHRAFERMPPGPVVIIGADIPDIQPHHIHGAFKKLGHHDAVFGPADDGGYWLVGQKRFPRTRTIFSDVRWSGPHALEDTCANLPGARIEYLETLIDVDDGDDFKRWTGNYAG